MRRPHAIHPGSSIGGLAAKAGAGEDVGRHLVTQGWRIVAKAAIFTLALLFNAVDVKTESSFDDKKCIKFVRKIHVNSKFSATQASP